MANPHSTDLAGVALKPYPGQRRFYVALTCKPVWGLRQFLQIGATSVGSPRSDGPLARSPDVPQPVADPHHFRRQGPQTLALGNSMPNELDFVGRDRALDGAARDLTSRVPPAAMPGIGLLLTRSIGIAGALVSDRSELLQDLVPARKRAPKSLEADVGSGCLLPRMQWAHPAQPPSHKAIDRTPPCQVRIMSRTP